MIRGTHSIVFAMYRYDVTDKTLVRQRVAQFRDQTQRFLKGALSEDEFRHLRLRNGLYIQRHAPMLRIAIPYGLLSTRSCAPWRKSRATTIAAMDISRRARISSSTGPSSNRFPIFCGTRRGGDARHPNQRQLHSQHHLRSSGRDHARRTRRSEALVRDHPPMVDVSSRVQLPAAQIQDRRDRRAARSCRLAGA